MPPGGRPGQEPWEILANAHSTSLPPKGGLSPPLLFGNDAVHVAEPPRYHHRV